MSEHQLPPEYRIITNGEIYKAQRKGLFGWYWTLYKPEYSYDGVDWIKKFNTKKEACQVALEHWQNRQSEMIRKSKLHPWRDAGKC